MEKWEVNKTFKNQDKKYNFRQPAIKKYRNKVKDKLTTNLNKRYEKVLNKKKRNL